MTIGNGTQNENSKAFDEERFFKDKNNLHCA